MRGINPKWPYIWLVKYCNLPRYLCEELLCSSNPGLRHLESVTPWGEHMPRLVIMTNIVTDDGGISLSCLQVPNHGIIKYCKDVDKSWYTPFWKSHPPRVSSDIPTYMCCGCGFLIFLLTQFSWWTLNSVDRNPILWLQSNFSNFISALLFPESNNKHQFEGTKHSSKLVPFLASCN